MPQVAVTIVTDNLDAVAVWILMAINRSGDLIVETGPATVAFELVSGLVKRSVAAAAEIGSLVLQVSVFTAKGRFGPFLLDDMLLLGCQFIEGLFIHDLDSCSTGTILDFT